MPVYDTLTNKNNILFPEYRQNLEFDGFKLEFDL